MIVVVVVIIVTLGSLLVPLQVKCKPADICAVPRSMLF
jgi:hypothetical protein